VDHYLTSLDTLSASARPDISMNSHPFLPLYRQLPTTTCGYVYLIVSVPTPSLCFIDEATDIRQSLRKHNTGYGNDKTRPTALHPWCVYAFVCGFEQLNDGHDESRICFYHEVKDRDISAGPDHAYKILQDKVDEWRYRGHKELIIVKCGELRREEMEVV